MSHHIDKESVIQHKKKSIKAVNRMLEGYINSGNDKFLKKADLISYWLESFSLYVSSEEKFDPRRLIRYSRGDVIRLNLGFNIGNEMGGLHFALALDNANHQQSGVITVIPLSSTDGRTIHSNNVDLGTELYSKINDNYASLLKKASEDLDGLRRIKNILDSITSENGSDSLPPETSEEVVLTLRKITDLESQVKRIERERREIDRLKTGTMAVVNQITTISKQRIYTPKKSEDFLYGISLSASAMEKINRKISELYLR